MSNIYDIVYAALNASGYPVYQESETPGRNALPGTYLTYMNVDDAPMAYTNGGPIGINARFMVKMYSTDPAITQGGKDTLNALMAGWMCIGGRDLPYDAETGHHGYTCDYRYFDF